MESNSSGGGGGGGEEHAHVVEMMATAESDSDQIAPLLTHSEKPRINIFSVSHPRPKSNREQVASLVETETSPFTQSIMWMWGGSRYSGLLCMALSSSIYCIMEVLSDVFSVQSIPLFEIAFTRCTIMAMLSFIWLRKSGKPVFGPTNVRKLLASRALVGYASLTSFVYCMQRLPLSQGIILSFTTPIMASVAARIILHEKIKIPEIGGRVREDEVDDSKILPYCSIEKKKKSIGEMEQEFLQALQVLKQIK